MTDVLWECFRYFVHMDESNAAIHCADVRYSPITFRLAEQLHELDMYPSLLKRNGDLLKRVMAANGTYAEDAGR